MTHIFLKALDLSKVKFWIQFCEVGLSQWEGRGEESQEASASKIDTYSEAAS